jgi:hypothetical protein
VVRFSSLLSFMRWVPCKFRDTSAANKLPDGISYTLRHDINSGWASLAHPPDRSSSAAEDHACFCTVQMSGCRHIRKCRQMSVAYRLLRRQRPLSPRWR